MMFSRIRKKKTRRYMMIEMKIREARNGHGFRFTSTTAGGALKRSGTTKATASEEVSVGTFHLPTYAYPEKLE